MATGAQKYPASPFRFRIQIDGIDRGGFRECSSLDHSSDPLTYREGTDPPFLRKLPGLTKHTDITLKWGIISGDSDIWQWRLSAEGTPQRKNGSIILLGDDGNPVAQWDFTNAWVVKWTGPALNAATGTDVAVVTLQITFEEMKQR